MKQFCALLLAAAMLLSLCGCLGRRPSKPEETKQPSDADVDHNDQSAAHEVVRYDVLEQILNDHAYGWVGGGMNFSRCGTRLYYPDGEYNTRRVLYYDFADGSTGVLAEDAENTLSGPPVCSSESIIVSSLPGDSDPLDPGTYESLHYHVYDLKTGAVTVMDKSSVLRPLAVCRGVVYGYALDETDDRNCVVISDREEDNVVKVPLPAGWYIQMLYTSDTGAFAVVSNGEGEESRLIGVSAEDIITLHTVTWNGIFDRGVYWYARAGEQGAELRKFDVETGSDELLGVVPSVSHIYFAAGDRIYYSRRLSDAGDISILYYDFSSSQETEISSDFPALGGW